MQKTKISFEQVIGDLKNKIYHPVYFLTGDEPYYIDKISDFIIDNVLTDEEKSFNQTILYGKETDGATITNVAKRFPMMANQQVVVVREAQETKNFDDLLYYFENPLKSTILVICYKYKELDKRKKAYKTIQQNTLYFESKKLYPDKIPGWISSLLKTKNYSIEPKAAVLLTEFLGNDLQKVENEIEKLILTLPENMKIITSDHIERNIGISKDYNIFEFQNALMNRDVLKANRIVQYFAANQKNHHITQIITNLYFYFTKILIYHVLKDKSKQNVASQLRVSPFFVPDYEKAARTFSLNKVVRIISYLREYDMKSKGYGNVSTDAEGLLKELTFKILH
jgi:DNA polymerase-3 subunit delta